MFPMPDVRRFARAARSLLRPVAASLAVLALAAGAAVAEAQEFKDPKLGYSIQPPRKWTKRPVAVSERFIVAKWESEREYEDRDPKSWDGQSHKPTLEVVVIPLSLASQKGGTVEKDAAGNTAVRLAAPFTDLKGWLEKSLPDRESTGFYFSKEEETVVGGVKVMQYEVTMEKVLDTWHRPKRVFAWAWYGPDAIYGAVGDTLIKVEADLKPDILAALKSVKIFPRTGVLPGAERTGEDVVVGGDASQDNSSDADRERRRKDAFGRQLKQLQDARAGWITKESANFTAVSHADPKFTKTVLDHAEALRGWLDKSMGYVGNGYAGKIVIQICKDRAERDSERETGGWWSADGCTVTTFKDTEGYSSWSWQDDLNRGIWDIWLKDKNVELSWKMPQWLDSGLDALVATAISKGSKIEFRPDTWDRVQIAVARRDGKLQGAEPYFTKTREELWKDWEVSRQGEYFVRYLAVGGAQRNPKFKNVLSDYLKNVVFLIDEANQTKKPEAAKEEAPKSEKEEEEMLRRRREDWSQSEKAFLDKLRERTFPGWTPQDWENLTRSYWKDLE